MTNRELYAYNKDGLEILGYADAIVFKKNGLTIHMTIHIPSDVLEKLFVGMEKITKPPTTSREELRRFIINEVKTHRPSGAYRAEELTEIALSQPYMQSEASIQVFLNEYLREKAA